MACSRPDPSHWFALQVTDAGDKYNWHVTPSATVKALFIGVGEGEGGLGFVDVADASTGSCPCPRPAVGVCAVGLAVVVAWVWCGVVVVCDPRHCVRVGTTHSVAVAGSASRRHDK